MSYAPKRPAISKRMRQFIYEREGGKCYLCGLQIAPGDPWQADHELARELGGSDEIANLRPAHEACHRIKSKADVKLIAKSNRIQRKHGPIEGRKVKKAIPSRPFHMKQSRTK